MMILSLIMLVFHSGAQEQLSLKQQADKLFERYEYFKSLDIYLEIAGKNNLAVTERIAGCYREMNDYKNAGVWYAKAVKQPKAGKIDHYYYAETLLRDQKFDEAKAQYKLYYTNNEIGLNLKLADCDSAELWMRQPVGCKVKDVEGLNSEYSDWGLSYNGKLGFIFASDRLTNDGTADNRTGNNWFKLYSANINRDEVSELPISDQADYHVGPMAINEAADVAYITVTTDVGAKELPLDATGKRSAQKLYTRRLELLMAKKINGQWVINGDFPYNNVREYSVGNAALSKDGKVIYFSSDMPGGQGKTDIWYCEKQADGNWGKPVNCGKTINTADEESFPYMDNNGTLYFASKGLPGMGGYDIYMVKGEKAEWERPQNLKYPVNTTSDDFYFVTRDGKSGYFSSNRDGGKGSDDIYSFALAKTDTTPHYKLRMEPIGPAQPPRPTKQGQNIVLNTIYFDLDKYNIRPDAAVELDRMAIMLKQQSNIKIEISGYTDTRATGQYNLLLSQHRAEATKDYLVDKGISAGRLTVKWYGKTHLANQCADGVNCPEADHQLNRRVEFKVISK
jgi:outer membrane protein OmpA-like peptidoglycan-associated protein